MPANPKIASFSCFAQTALLCWKLRQSERISFFAFGALPAGWGFFSTVTIQSGVGSICPGNFRLR
jgi:hypothetical protein